MQEQIHTQNSALAMPQILLNLQKTPVKNLWVLKQANFIWNWTGVLLESVLT